MNDLHPAHARKIHDLQHARQMIKSAFKDCADLIEQHMEAQRYRSIALMRLEEGVLWAMQDITKQIDELSKKSRNAQG